MSDRELRELERDAPLGGPAARVRLARALVRAGRTDDAVATLAGDHDDAEARRELARLPAWTSAGGPGGARHLDVPAVTRPALLWASPPLGTSPDAGRVSGQCALATAFAVVAATPVGGGRVLDARTGAERWSFPEASSRSPALLGDVLVLGEGPALRGHDLWTGERLWQVEVGAHALVVPAGPRDLVVAGEEEVRAWRLEERDGPPRPLWRTLAPQRRRRPALLCGGGLVLVGNPTLALDAAIGARRFELAGSARAVDERGLVVKVRDQLRAFTLDGEERPLQGLEGESVLLALTPGQAHVAPRADGTLGTPVVLDRAGGPPREAEVVPAEGVQEACAARDTLYGSATRWDRFRLFQSIVARDATGAHRWTFDLPLGPPRQPGIAQLACGPRCVYVLTTLGSVIAIGEG